MKTSTFHPAGSVVVAGFYHFAPLLALPALKRQLRALCGEHDVKGSILLATEGINGTIAGTSDNVDAVLAWLRALKPLQNLKHQESHAVEVPFYRLKVEIKKEIVTFKVPGIDPTQRVGRYVSAAQWDAVVADPNVVLVDTRNAFEVELGTFRGAKDPMTTSFSEFPAFVDAQLAADKTRTVALFCTGGIRCEKATSYLLSRGFTDVVHLQGGILRYLQHTPADAGTWQGECFVFDGRVTVGHGLAAGRAVVCHACFMPVDAAAADSPHYEVGVSCPRCFAKTSPQKLAGLRERQRQMKLAKERNQQHLGYVMPLPTKTNK